MRVTGEGPDASHYRTGRRMKYFVLLVGIIGLVTYIFVGGPKAVTGAAVAMPDRRERVWDSIAQLEARRRDMLIMADLRLRASSPSACRNPRWRSSCRRQA